MAVENSAPRTTPPVAVSFPCLFTKRGYQGGTPCFSVKVLFDKKKTDHMDFLKNIKLDGDSVMERQWPDAATRPRIPIVGHDKSPVKDGDKGVNGQGIPFVEKNPEVAGHYFFSCSNYKDTLTVVDKGKNEIIDSGEIYSGCICAVNVNVYARTRSDNPGISIGLNGVQKLADGERIGGGGGPSVDDMFEAGASEDPANYPDPLGDNGGFDDDIPF